MRLQHEATDTTKLAARLVALIWASQRKDAGQTDVDLRALTAQVLREVRKISGSAPAAVDAYLREEASK
jgi:hypothetical protein